MSSIEAIAYTFVSHYYKGLHEDPASLARLYTEDAQLAHSKVPTGPGVNFINKVIEMESHTSMEQIEAFYADSKLANSKIRISNIDSQYVLGTSILISVLGELALETGVAVYRFTQSFILNPAKVANTYCIANDIFRLIPDEEYELHNGETQTLMEEAPMNGGLETSVEEPDKEETPAKDEEKGVEEEKDEEQQQQAIVEEKPALKEKKTEEPVKEEVKEITPEPVVEKKEEEVKEEKREEKRPQVKEEKVQEEEKKAETKDEVKEKEMNKENEPVEEAPKPAAPSSWAQAVVSGAKKNPTISAVLRPKVVKPAAAPKPAEPAPSTQSPSSTQKQGGKKKPFVPDLSHAVVVKNVENLKSPQIKKGFEDAFGRVSKAEPRGHWALVAFETAEARDAALDRKSLVIDGSKVLIEAKTAKFEFQEKKKKTKQGQQQTQQNGGGQKRNTK